MSKTQPTLCPSRREQRLKISSVNLGSPFDKDESSSTFNSSEESLSSDNEDIFTPLPLPILNHQYVQRRNIPAKIASKNKERSYNSRLKKQNFPKYITPSVTQIMLPSVNQPSTLIYHIPSKNDYNAHYFWGQLEGYVESANESENLSSTSRSKSMKFHKNSKPSHHTSVAFNYPTSHNCERKRSNDNSFQGVNRLSCCCCSRILSKQAVSSNTHKLVLHCIRNSQTPLNIYTALDIPTTPCQCRPYFQLLDFPVSHSTSNNHSPLEELENISTVSRNTIQSSTSPYPLFHISPIETSRKTANFRSPNSSTSYSIPDGLYSLDKSILSRCSIGRKVGSLETTPEDATSLPSKAEPIFNAPSISKAPESLCRESWQFQDEPKKINQSSRCPLNSYNLLLKGNFICQKSPAEDRSHSPSSMVIEVGSMETTRENNTSLSYNAEPISNASPKSPIFQTTSKKYLHAQDDTKSNKQSSWYPLASNYVPLKGNYPYSKSVSERKWQNNKDLKNENSLKSSSISRVKKEDTLQRDESTSSNSASLFTLGSNKHIQNASVSISQPLIHSDILYHYPITRNSNGSRVKDFFLEENNHFNPESNLSFAPPFLYPKESFSPDVEKPFAPPNSPNPKSSLEEWCFTENIAGSKSQSFASLSMMCGPPTEEISEMSIFSKEPNSKRNSQSKKERKKTRKKSKFVSCFIAFFRPSSPWKGDQT